MFTGIIEEVGIVKSVRKQNLASVMTISAKKVIEDIKTGDSISTNGVCLTVTAFDSSGFTVDVMPETHNRSGLSVLRAGDKVNLERALRLSDRLGGHLVSGHIDGTGKISRIRKDENAVWLTVAADPGILRYIIEKGSVALDGISLTLASVDERSFEVSVIPHTWNETTLSGKSTGSDVNIECDLLGKYTEKLLRGDKCPITLDYLKEMGF